MPKSVSNERSKSVPLLTPEAAPFFISHPASHVPREPPLSQLRPVPHPESRRHVHTHTRMYIIALLCIYITPFPPPPRPPLAPKKPFFLRRYFPVLKKMKIFFKKFASEIELIFLVVSIGCRGRGSGRWQNREVKILFRERKNKTKLFFKKSFASTFTLTGTLLPFQGKAFYNILKQWQSTFREKKLQF